MHLSEPAAEQMEIRRYSSLHFLKLVEDNCEVGFWTADMDTEVIDGSVGLFHILGLDPSEGLTFAKLAKLVHPADRAQHADKIELLRAGQQVRREFRVVRPDRTQRFILSRGEVIFGSDDKPRFAIGVFQDVTSRQQSQAEAQHEHKRFAALMEATAAVVWILGPDGAVRNIPQWEKLTGQSADEVEGKGWLDAVHPEDRERTLAAWTTAVSHATPYNTEFRVLCADGVFRWFNARGVPIFNREGVVQEWIGITLQVAGQNRFTRGAPTADPEVEIVTPAQIRGARGILNLSYEEVARRAGISPTTIRRLEDERLSIQSRPDTLRAVKSVLEEAGVEFLNFPNGGAPGVCPAARNPG